MCKKWVHLKCTNLSKIHYIALQGRSEDWFCSSCLQTFFPFNHIEDVTEFLLAIQDYSLLNNCYDSLKDLVFNPYAFASPLTNLPDLDPDNQFYSGNNNLNHDSEYFFEERFATKFCSNSTTFSLIHFNARSLSHNFDKINDYLNILNFSIPYYWNYRNLVKQ